ncbi:MAG: hypothetical protein ACKV2T_36630 [Kofleriaceae bacterium]
MSPLDTMTGLGGNTAEATRLVWVVATAIGIALLVVLAIVYRRARAQRDLEEAERLISERFGPE